MSTNTTNIQFEHGDWRIIGTIEWCLSEGSVTVIGKEYKEENSAVWDVIPINGNTSKAKVGVSVGSVRIRCACLLVEMAHVCIYTSLIQVLPEASK